MEKKFIKAEKMESSDSENSIVGWASKPTMDRDRELILANAWQLDNYRKNPVIMLAHDYHTLPIGKCLWIKSTDSGLRFKAKFANTDRGREVYSLYKEQFLNGFSVGFKPRPGGVIDNPSDVKYKGVKRLFTDVELMEISCVPIPANQDAMIDQSSFIKYVKDGNIITKGLKDELEAIIEIIEKSDDDLTIEVKATDPNTDIETKTEDLTESVTEIKTEDAEIETEEEMLDTKAVTPEADETEEDFMTRCMADPSMKKMNEGFRTNACKLMWKNQSDKKEEENIHVTIHLDGEEIGKVIEKATPVKQDDESEEEFVARFLGDEKTSVDYPDEKDRMAAAKEAWAKREGAKKEPEQAAVITKVESVQDFIKRILPDKSIDIKTAEELAQVFEKSSEYDEMKETVSAMESQAASMEIAEPMGSTKSADAEGNPSLYDLTGAVDRALNPMGQDRGFPSAINGPMNPPYRSVIDIFAVNYPSGHVVYSEYDKAVGQSKYFQIGYEYDLKMRTATVVGEPEEVLQSWISERYIIEKSEDDVESKDEEDIETKAGKVLSAKNKKILSDCMDQMMSAHAAMEEMMAMAEGVSEEKEEGEIIEKEEDDFEIIEKEDHIEFDLDVPVEKAEDGMLDIDENMIKNAIASALKKNEMKVDAKSVTEEVFAKLMGKATL